MTVNPLDGDGNGVGGDNFILDFSVQPSTAPETGFVPGARTRLSASLEPIGQTCTGIQLVIPKLGQDLHVVGFPVAVLDSNAQEEDSAEGSSKVIVVPELELASRYTCPPCASTDSRTNDRPIPVPTVLSPIERSAWAYLLKI